MESRTTFSREYKYEAVQMLTESGVAMARGCDTAATVLSTCSPTTSRPSLK